METGKHKIKLIEKQERSEMACDTQSTRQDYVEKELSSVGFSGLVWSFIGFERLTLLTTVEEGALVAQTTAAVCC